MNGVNQIILVGHLGRAPDVRRTGDGNPVVLLSLATSDSWHDKHSGERRERTEWHKVVIFNEELGKIAGQQLKKGSKVYVEGKVRSRLVPDKRTDRGSPQDRSRITDRGTPQDRQKQQQRVTEIVLEPYKGQLQLLDRVEHPAPSLDSYGRVSTRSTVPDHRSHQQLRDYDDPRMGMGAASPKRMPLDDFNDDIPF